jgi:hypothetical protein
MNSGGAALFTGGLSALFIFLVHFANVLDPFRYLKNAFKEALLNEFMATYHPNLNYSYYPEDKDGKQIIKYSNLIKADRYEEEDVIEGSFEHNQFYISEVNLKKTNGKSTKTIFKGMLFHLRIPGAQFPTSQIQSEPNLLKMIFGGFTKNEHYGFWYEVADVGQFEEKLGVYFPFIQHLMKHQGDVRIATINDTMTILIESDTKFFDDPKPSMNKTFLNKAHYKTLVKQLNSFLFIVESFGQKLRAEEVEEQLELKVLEYAKNYGNNNSA